MVRAAFVVMMLVGCTTNRVSDNFACTTDADCDPGRVCDTGYCVVGKRLVDARPFNDAPVCPAVCGGSCDFSTMSCSITGNGVPVTCPAGWNCTITCAAAGACPTVACTGAKRCDVSCTGAGACGNISCATADCTAVCAGGTNACGNLNCTSGDCTRVCTGGNACGAMSCTTGDCTQTCSGGNQACGNLNCGTGKCSATCQGTASACKDVTCNQSCGCEVNCDFAENMCPANMQCKTTGNGVNQKYCSDSGVQGDVCTLDGAGGVTGCNTCP